MRILANRQATPRSDVCGTGVRLLALRSMRSPMGPRMSQSLRIKRELREVVQIGKPAPQRLVDGAVWHSAASHSDVNNFLARQIARGLVPKERK